MNSRAFSLSLAVSTVLALLLCGTGARAQSWSPGHPFPTTVVRAAGVWFPANGRFYVLGGRSSDTAGTDLLNPREFNPATGSWTVKSSVFNDTQVNNMVGAALVDAGTPVIFLVGGSAAGASTSTNAVRRYDPATDTLTLLGSDPWPGTSGTTLPGGGAVYNNKLYVIGGFTINVSMTSDIWEFDPSAPAGSKWTLKTAALPVPRGYVPCATIGSLIYTAGGAAWTGTTLADSNDSFVYDPVADLITPISSIPRPTGETRAVAEGGDMWVLGGGRVAPNPSSEVDAYSPGSSAWSLAPAFVTPRRNFAADADPATGRIYLVGGYAPATPTDMMEIFSGNPIQSYCGQGDLYLATVCPCGVQGAPGSGCENSALTGGALLSATGTAVPDTLVLGASGLLPNSLCVVVQGTTSQASGIVFGTGVRCANGTLKRLFVKNALGGALSAPGTGDPSVSARSASLGDTLLPGATRFYTVYYQDPAGGPAGCNGASFNASNGLSIHF